MATASSQTDLGTGSVGKLLFRLSVPAITAQLINLLYNLVDRMYIGHIADVGALALTGVGVTLPLIVIISAFSMLVGMGGSPRAAIAMGEGDNQRAEKILGSCVTTLVLIAALLTAVVLVFGDQLLYLFGASENTFPYASSYMRIYACGTVFVQLALGLNTFITTQGFAKTSMFTVLIGAVLNIILDPIFIFVFDMGVAGAAAATILSQGVSAIWVVHFLMSRHTILRIRRDNLRIRAKTILPCLALGLAPFIMQATESILTICFNASLLRYGGDTAVGAMTILSSVMQFSMLPLMGLTQGAQPIMSYNYGAGNAGRVKKTFKLLLIASLAFSTLIWGLAMGAPQLFAALFTTDAALTETTVWAMRVYMAVALVFGVQISCQQTFIALDSAGSAVFLALLRKVVLLIPLIFILPQLFADPVFAVFLAEPAADFLAVSVTVILFALRFPKLLQKVAEKKMPADQPAAAADKP